MPVPFIMPKFDMDQEKATIISWCKKEGDFVKFDETVLTVETEKVAIDVPAPATGTLARILFKDGDVVPVTKIDGRSTKRLRTGIDGKPASSARAYSVRETSRRLARSKISSISFT